MLSDHYVFCICQDITTDVVFAKLCVYPFIKWQVREKWKFMWISVKKSSLKWIRRDCNWFAKTLLPRAVVIQIGVLVLHLRNYGNTSLLTVWWFELYQLSLVFLPYNRWYNVVFVTLQWLAVISVNRMQFCTSLHSTCHLSYIFNFI